MPSDDVDPVPVAAPVSPTEFRSVMSRFATGVTVVTCRQDGFDHAMTANSFTSVSLEPALVLVCVEDDSRFHEAITAVGRWSVSVLAEHQRGRATWFATRGRPLVGQFDSTPTRRSPVTDALWLDEALVTLDCRTVDVHRAGDHDIVVGEVLDLHDVRPDASPLLYFGSRFRTLGDQSGG
ncbi:MAG: flavin reductase family protein [Candidatus Nanopelagicales bacterium]|jgi:flavin reductase (DIM6/NTAB) family NADH-FMN oxidoreductase RutF